MADFYEGESLIPSEQSQSEEKTNTDSGSETREETKPTKDLAKSFFAGDDIELEKVKDSVKSKEQPSKKDSNDDNAEQSKTNESEVDLLKGTNFKTLEDMKKSALSATEKIRTQSEQLKELQKKVEELSNPDAKKTDIDPDSESKDNSDVSKMFDSIDEESLEILKEYLDEDTAKKFLKNNNAKFKNLVDTILNSPAMKAANELSVERQKQESNRYAVDVFQESLRQYISENDIKTASEEKAIRMFFKEHGKPFEKLFTEKLENKDEQISNIKSVLKIAHLASKGANVDNYLKLAQDNANKKVSEIVSSIASGKVVLTPRDKVSETKNKDKGFTATDYFKGKNPDGKGVIELH